MQHSTIKKVLEIRVRRFDFEKFIYFHGWVYLSPFVLCDGQRAIERYLRLNNCKNIKAKIEVTDGAIYTTLKISTPANNKVSDKDKDTLRAQIRRMFCLDQDFSEFHKICKNNPFLDFVYKKNCRGMLRSPTSYEDLIKTICTTNCDWRNTKKMCAALCNLDGENFPSSKVILNYNEKKLSKMAPLGYRARTVLEASKLVEEGKLALDDWAKEKNHEKIRRSLKAVWGIGDYCVNHIVALLGDYSFIPVDSEVLKYLRDVYFKGREVSAKEAVKPFEDYKEYKFLAYKYERMARKMNYINNL